MRRSFLEAAGSLRLGFQLRHLAWTLLGGVIACAAATFGFWWLTPAHDSKVLLYCLLFLGMPFGVGGSVVGFVISSFFTIAFHGTPSINFLRVDAGSSQPTSRSGYTVYNPCLRSARKSSAAG